MCCVVNAAARTKCKGNYHSDENNAHITYVRKGQWKPTAHFSFILSKLIPKNIFDGKYTAQRSLEFL